MENPQSFCPSCGTLRPLSGQAECEGELVALVAILFFFEWSLAPIDTGMLGFSKLVT